MMGYGSFQARFANFLTVAVLPVVAGGLAFAIEAQDRADPSAPAVSQGLPSTRQASAAQPAPKKRIFDVVFDIDWTIADSPQGISVRADRYRRILGEDYRIVDHAEATLEFLAKQPDVRVSFFSAGDRERNVALLKSIRLSDGRTAYDVAHRVFSKENMTAIPEEQWPANARFPDKFKKDLRLLGNDLEDVILVEDIARFSLQPNHTLYVGDTKLPFESYARSDEAAVDAAIAEWKARNHAEWFASRHRMAGVKTILAETLEEARSTGRSFLELIREKQNLPRDPFIRKGLRSIGYSTCTDIEATVQSLIQTQ